MRTQTSYKPQLSRTWWLKHQFYRLYMLREATVIPLLFFVGCLLYGIFSLTQGEAQWQNWLIFMAKPWVVLLNLLALAASLYHAWTFFQLFPQVMPIKIAGKQVPNIFIVIGQWIGVVVVAILLAIIVTGVWP